MCGIPMMPPADWADDGKGKMKFERVLAHVGGAANLVTPEGWETIRLRVKHYIWKYPAEGRDRPPVAWCTACGRNLGDLRFRHGTSVCCPSCGTPAEYRQVARGHKKLFDEFVVYEWRKSVLDPEILIMTAVHVWRDSRWDNPEGKPALVHPGAVYLFRPGRAATVYKNHNWGVGTAQVYPGTWAPDWQTPSGAAFGNGLCYWRSIEGVAPDHREWNGKTIDYYTNYRQFRDALRGTRIGRLYDLLNGSLEPRAALELHAVASCAKRPWLEYLAKSGQRPLAAQLMRMNSIPRDVIANQRAKKPRELLGLTEGQWFEARRDGVQLTTEALECLNKLRKLGLEGVKISEVAEMVAKSHGMAAYRLGLIAPGTRDYSETVSDLLKAAGTPEKLRRKVYRRIVLRELEHATEWRDYIRQLRRLGEDLTDPQLILPRDVRQMHQRMIARENALKDAETLRKIEAQAKDFDKRLEKLRKEYTFEAAGLVLRPYDSAAEVIAEGRALAICIGSYAESYVKGSTIICCLRRAEEPDEPWRAVEFSTRGRLVQDRGYRNDQAYTSSDGPVMEPGTKKQLRNFWAAWNKAHGRDEKGRKTA